MTSCDRVQYPHPPPHMQTHAMPEMNDCMNLQCPYTSIHTVDHAPAGSDTHEWHVLHIVYDGIDEIHRSDGIYCVCMCLYRAYMQLRLSEQRERRGSTRCVCHDRDLDDISSLRSLMHACTHFDVPSQVYIASMYHTTLCNHELPTEPSYSSLEQNLHARAYCMYMLQHSHEILNDLTE